MWTKLLAGVTNATRLGFNELSIRQDLTFFSVTLTRCTVGCVTNHSARWLYDFIMLHTRGNTIAPFILPKFKSQICPGQKKLALSLNISDPSASSGSF